MKPRKAVKCLGFLLLAFMPNAVKRCVYNHMLGAQIHPTARIGISYIDVKKIKLGAGSGIGHFNAIRNLELLELGEGSSMGRFNNVSALPLDSARHFAEEKDRFPALILGIHASITGKHNFDCNDTIRIGDYATIAGSGSVFLTHGINIKLNKQEAAPVSIGKYTLVNTRCVIVKGAVLPDYSVLGANSVLYKSYDGEPYKLYSGVPALPVKDLDVNSLYFHRKELFVY